MSMRTGKDKQRVFRLGFTTALVVVGVLSLGQLRQALAAPAREDFLVGGRAARVALSFNPFKLTVQPVGPIETSEEIGPETASAGTGEVLTSHIGQSGSHYVPRCWIPHRPWPRSRRRPWSWHRRSTTTSGNSQE